MIFSEIRQSYIDDGFDIDNATTRTAQDVVLELISSSPLAKSVTIKGGVVMHANTVVYKSAYAICR